MPSATTSLAVLSALFLCMVLQLARLLWRSRQWHSAQVADLHLQLKERDLALQDDRRALRDLEAAAALVLGRLADHVEMRVGHTDAVLVAERIAGNARRGWWEISAEDRACLAGWGIETDGAGVVDVVAAALSLSEHLLRAEFQNAEVARLCQIIDRTEQPWLPEAMSRLERLAGSRHQAALVLQRFLDAWRATEDVRYAAQMLDWHAAPRHSGAAATPSHAVADAA